MKDVREEILARVLAIAEATPDVKLAARNRTEIGDDELPAVVLLDADEQPEQRADDQRGRRASAHRHMIMTPQIVISMSTKAEDIGSALNDMRRDLISRIVNDTELDALVTQNGAILYGGCQSDLGVGRAMQGQMALVFEFHYPLKPSDLVL